MAAGVYFTVNSSSNQKNDLVSKGVEALSNGEAPPPGIEVNCVPSQSSTCVNEGWVVLKTYYSQH